MNGQSINPIFIFVCESSLDGSQGIAAATGIVGCIVYDFHTRSPPSNIASTK